MATALQEQSYSFDDRQIQWSPFPGIENASFSLCDYDEERGIVDLIFKFEPDCLTFNMLATNPKCSNGHFYIAHANNKSEYRERSMN